MTPTPIAWADVYEAMTTFGLQPAIIIGAAIFFAALAYKKLRR